MNRVLFAACLVCGVIDLAIGLATGATTTVLVGIGCFLCAGALWLSVKSNQ